MNDLNSINSKFNTLVEPYEFVKTNLNPKTLTTTINFIKQIRRWEQALY